jgi:hypothetical protein
MAPTAVTKRSVGKSPRQQRDETNRVAKAMPRVTAAATRRSLQTFQTAAVTAVEVSDRDKRCAVVMTT